MRWIYSLAWCLALPLGLARLWWRGRKEPGYRQHIGERLGFYPRLDKFSQTNQPVLWVHAVSVGETRAAEPVIDALLQRYPSGTILLTHMTPTGRAAGQALYARHGKRLVQSYLPYDINWMARRFLRQFEPRLCILMETEVWPNLVAQCARRRVPVALVNARLSERSLKKAGRYSGLMQNAANSLACVAAQTEADAVRLRALGAANVSVTGSVKFDVTPPEAALCLGNGLRRCIGQRPVFLCASTREGEEALILDALAQIERQQGLGDLLLVLVPRHPQRFDAVAGLVAERGFGMRRRSELALAQGGTDSMSLPGTARVLLGDSMGEMFAYYAACDVAFIGGSLVPLGGQNLIEACALGKPVLLGLHTFNFDLVSDDAVAAGAAMRVTDAADLVRQALLLVADSNRRAEMGRQAQAFALQHRGATERTMDLLNGFIR